MPRWMSVRHYSAPRDSVICTGCPSSRAKPNDA
jgi:hypothetical protein